MLVKKPACFIIIALFALVVCFITSSTADISCLDPDGNEVDWFIGYKLPLNKKDKNSLVKKGQAYVYITSDDWTVKKGDQDNAKEKIDLEEKIDSEQFIEKFAGLFNAYINKLIWTPVKKPEKKISREWINPNKSISGAAGSVLGRTLAILYSSQGKGVSSVLYNDDPTGTSEFKRDSKDKGSSNQNLAHAKGVLMMEATSDTGVWLTHSIPRFPNVRDTSYSYPQSGFNNGQTFMCISFRISVSGSQIVDHLVKMQPNVYEYRVNKKLADSIPALKNLDDGDGTNYASVTDEQNQLAQNIITRGGQMLRLFSKSSKFNDDLYASWIRDDMNSDLLVETWQNGMGTVLPSTCPLKEHTVKNVAKLEIPIGERNGQPVQTTWKHTKDHSKWAISEKPGFVCISDINRVKSQYSRGGGAVCIRCPTCWLVFKNLIQDVENCPKVSRGRSKKDKEENDPIEALNFVLRLNDY